MKLKIDRFVVALIIVIAIAYFFPQGATNKYISLDTIGEHWHCVNILFLRIKTEPGKNNNRT